MTGRRRGHPGLAPFLVALEDRLRALSAEDLREALLVHAGRLPPAERAPFLAIFDRTQAGVDQAPLGLIAEIDSFVSDLSEGLYGESWEDDDDYDAHDDRGYAWAPEMDRLLADASRAFAVGDLDLAREAYGRLLRAFTLEEEGRFPGPGMPEQFLQTDLDEAKTRQLRAVYETTALSERPGALLEEIRVLRYVGAPPSLRAIVEARLPGLPDLEAFLPAWAEALREVVDPEIAPDVRDLRIEAAALRDGADGLGRLARDPRTGDPKVFEEWIEALLRERRANDALAAGREALAHLPARGETRAAIAERLAGLEEDRGDADAVLAARREAWRAAPSTARLLALTDAAAGLGTQAGVLAEEADRAASGAPPDRWSTDERVICELLLLAGRPDAALARVRHASPLLWHHADHPGPLVTGYLLMAACGFGRAPEREGTATLLAALVSDHGPERARLAALLAERIAAGPFDASDAERSLHAARELIDGRVEAVVRGQHRRSYRDAARLAGALAEALALIGRPPGAGAEYLASLHGRYPRHVSFKEQLDLASGASPLLPTRVRRRR